MDEPTTLPVWDPLVRLFHWSLVLAYLVTWLTEDDWLRPHEIAGYVIGALVLFRVAWGLFGTRHARFTDFVRPPGEVLRYLKDAALFRAPRHLGHNPAGGAMVIALLVTLLLAVISGVFALGVEEARGPAAGLMQGLSHDAGEFFEESHEVLANLTLMLVIAHVIGVLVASVQHRENLVRAMVTGRKPKETGH